MGRLPWQPTLISARACPGDGRRTFGNSDIFAGAVGS